MRSAFRALGLGLLGAAPGAALFGLAVLVEQLGIVTGDALQAALVGIPLALVGFVLGVVKGFQGPRPPEEPGLPGA